MSHVSFDLKNKVILITGASRGIGRSVALNCARAGAEVIISGRTIGALEELDDEISKDGGQATIVELDQADTAAMSRLGQAIAKRWGRLDGFVANAGQLGQMAPMPHIDPEIFEKTILVNLTSIWYQIAAFDNLLRASDAGRAVLVSSGAANGARAYWGAYAVSKAGLESMARAWAAESEKTELRINLIDPGATRTAMRAAAYPGEDPENLHTAEDITPAFLHLLSPACKSQGVLYKAAELSSQLG
jgi:NAD(P)-dependent dehydrogenase (short-subunit alcohol dehydrogenase family)